MIELTVTEAADYLGVHQARVRELISTGTLAGRRVGRQWVVAREDLERQRELVEAGATSRAMSTRVAWAAAELLDGGRAESLSASERSRLARRLRGWTGDLRVFRRWLASRQVAVVRYRCAESDLDDLLREQGVVATGVSASDAYDLGLARGRAADAYVAAEALQTLIDRYFLLRSERGNLLLRTVDGDEHTRTATMLRGRLYAARLMTAVDLMESTDSRSVRAGRELLTRALSSFNAAARGART